MVEPENLLGKNFLMELILMVGRTHYYEYAFRCSGDEENNKNDRMVLIDVNRMKLVNSDLEIKL